MGIWSEWRMLIHYRSMELDPVRVHITTKIYFWFGNNPPYLRLFKIHPKQGSWILIKCESGPTQTAQIQQIDEIESMSLFHRRWRRCMYRSVYLCEQLNSHFPPICSVHNRIYSFAFYSSYSLRFSSAHLVLACRNIHRHRDVPWASLPLQEGGKKYAGNGKGVRWNQDGAYLLWFDIGLARFGFSTHS